MMRITIEVLKILTLLIVLAVSYHQAAYAQSARKLAKKPITVRLCPATCRAVNGHGLKPGGDVSVYESRSGWARVSAYLDRSALVPSFGKKITKKPALWVPTSSLVSKNAAAKPAAKKTKSARIKSRDPTKRVSVVDRIARLRRIPRPVFRPGTRDVQPVQAVVTEPVTTATTTIAVSEPVKKPVIVDTTPVKSVSKGTDSQKSLTWEEVQAKIAAQAAGKTTQTPQPEKVIQQSDEDKAAAAKKAKAAADAKAAAYAKAAKIAADAKAATAAADAKAIADAKKKEEQRAKAAEAARAEAARKEVEAAKQADSKKVAVVLPPKEVEAPEPTFKSAKADPIELGARPKTLTKKLLDKRLKKLPGRKSRAPKEVVIALRHYALGLLNSGECKGIEKGGASAVPGMLYVTCSDDPTYLRQFPLVEETW